MTIRDRAYNVIKALKKVWFADYCDAQIEIEKAIETAVLEEREACARIVEPSRAAEEGYETALCWELAGNIRNRKSE